MYRLNMSCQTTLMYILMVTLVTSVLDSFIYRLSMSSQTTLLCILLVTLVTSILDPFMYSFNVSLNTTPISIRIFTLWTLKLGLNHSNSFLLTMWGTVFISVYACPSVSTFISLIVLSSASLSFPSFLVFCSTLISSSSQLLSYLISRFFSTKQNSSTLS